VDGVLVEASVDELEARAGEFFTAKDAVAANHLETGVDVFFGLVKILDALGGFQQDVAHDVDALGTEVPNLAGLFYVPAEVVGEKTSTDLGILVLSDLLLLDGLDDLWAQNGGSEIQSVMLVDGLRHDNAGSVGRDGLTVLDNWLRDSEADGVVAEVFAEVLQADLEMEFADTGYDVLSSGLIHNAQDARVGLFKTLHAFLELRKVLRVVDVDGNANDRRDRELHGTDRIAPFERRDCAGLDDVLIDTH